MNVYYRIVNCFTHLLTYYAKPILVQFEVSEMALAIFYIALVVNNFKVSSLVYDYLVVSFFD